MKPLKLLSISGLILGLLTVLLSLFFMLIYKSVNIQDETVNNISTTPASLKDLVDSKDEQKIREENTISLNELPTQKEVGIKESGWIPNWAFDLGIESLKKNKEILDTVLPVLLTVDADGQVVSRGVPETKIEVLTNYCKKNSIKVIATISSADLIATSSIFRDRNSLQQHISTIVSLIDRYGFDGIDLDYEMIDAKYRDEFSNLVEELSKQLKRRDKTLSVTLLPQWKNADYTDNRETRIAQDYAQIGKYADEVRIMTYDYTLQSSKIPGPIAPITWIHEVLEYTLSHIPKEKVWLGVHLYGYQWSSDRTVAFTYTTTESAILNSNIQHIFDEDIGEGYAEFKCEDNFLCKAYFQTSKGIDVRRNIAKEYGLAGVSYWRLGGELDLLSFGE